MANKIEKVLIVCMGNICRSPTAEAVLRSKAAQAGVALEIDSAGTIGYHQGNTPDERSRAAGEARGYSFAGIRARQVVAEDFERFDYILAADQANLRDLIAQCSAHHRQKLALFMSYSSASVTEIPDPYYGGAQGFETVLDLIEAASEQFLTRLSR